MNKPRIYLTKTRSGHTCCTVKYRGCTLQVGKKFDNPVTARLYADNAIPAFMTKIDAALSA